MTTKIKSLIFFLILLLKTVFFLLLSSFYPIVLEFRMLIKDTSDAAAPAPPAAPVSCSGDHIPRRKVKT